MDRKCKQCDSHLYYAKGWCQKCYDKNSRKRGECTKCGKETCRSKYTMCTPCANRIPGRQAGKILSTETRLKISISRTGKMLGEKHHSWQGDFPSYTAVHNWIKKQRGKAKDYDCELCGKQAQNWSNKDHQYKRNIKDFWPLCSSCHKKYDIKEGLIHVSGESHWSYGKSPSLETRRKISNTLRSKARVKTAALP